VTFTMWLYPIGTQTGWAGLLVTRGGGVEGGLNYNDQGMLGYTWNNNSTWNYVSGLVIPSGQWSFVAVVIQPTQAILYLYNSSGQLSATNAIAHTSDVFGGNWLIGADGTGGGRVFNGVIDELAIYTSALTPAQVQQLYSTGAAPPVKLTIERVGTSVKLTWPQGTLLQADSLGGPWTTNNVPSPYTVAPSAAKQFYRVIVH
jgi:Concanavalin A-like lectin/glucanases superfamily